MARLFLALWPDQAVRQQLAAARDAWRWPRGATPVSDGRLHLTLHFLGDLADERVPALANGLAAPVTPFRLSFGMPVLWHHGIAVLEPLSTPAALLDLHTALAERIAAHGLTVEPRAFKPHVTLARRAAQAIAPDRSPAIEWDIRHYALMQSTLGPDGRYTVLREFH